jgi:hypothetical protein
VNLKNFKEEIHGHSGLKKKEKDGREGEDFTLG